MRATTIALHREFSESVATIAGMNGKRVLVVDDEPSIVDAVSTALRYEGYESATAEESL